MRAALCFRAEWRSRGSAGLGILGLGKGGEEGAREGDAKEGERELLDPNGIPKKGRPLEVG